MKRLTRVLEATARALFTNFAVFIKANLSGLNSWGLLMRKSREKIWNWWRCQMSIMRTKERCREIRGIFPTSSFFPILEVNWPRFSLISLQMMLGTMRLKLFWSRSQKKIVPYEFVKQHIVMRLRGCSQFFDQLTNLDSIFTK